ncbi:hypothetical protein Tdes44962_MAKER03427 [Teratosphaeria destructans]|uniref:Uncharacterized protein n=1 Tax=Teratosphaeria destructans TaxID=418781 RepID=A0A9W7W1K8_9PEZI|nr:hypothetical protein Tdes44962_MAKER03427 [Teratosphaeria destructans]
MALLHDFCCSKDCCDYFIKAARVQSNQDMGLILRGLEKVSIEQVQAAHPELFQHYQACAETLKQEVDAHGACNEKRAIWEREVHQEQDAEVRMDGMDSGEELASKGESLVNPPR